MANFFADNLLSLFMVKLYLQYVFRQQKVPVLLIYALWRVPLWFKSLKYPCFPTVLFIMLHRVVLPMESEGKMLN